MSKGEVSYNLDNLVSLSDERRRVVDAVEEAQWQDDWERDDQLKIELEYINSCIAKGDLYAPLF
tara:strand:- start:898 stop:1089 length:192 start_codon:yes stop_codon:yes gene_type:complete